MNKDLLCRWLDLREPCWPPDPFVLLGLPPGECDPAQVEVRVHDRLAKLRCYQCSHPLEATEGMNRLAQAFVFLNELAAKTHRPSAGVPAANGSVAVPEKSPPPSSAFQDTGVLKRTVLDWQSVPPPVRRSGEMPALPSGEVKTVTESPQPRSASPTNFTDELAQFSPEARRGLGSLPAVIERVDLTRKYLWAWQKAGKFLRHAQRKLNRPVEEQDLAHRLHAIYEISQIYPGFIGQPGLPGYRVVAMARLEMTALMFKNLGEDQRQALAQDWQAGHQVLLSHRKFLRQQFKKLRRKNVVVRILAALRAFVNDHPGWVWALFLLGVCLLAFSFCKWM